MKKQRPIFAAPVLSASMVGLISVLLTAVFRNMAIQNTVLSDIGPGYISLTAPVVRGYDLHLLYRIMHNLTVTWSLVVYVFLMGSGVFLIARAPWKPQTIRLCHAIVAIVHILFIALFVLSLFLPVGDMVTTVAKELKVSGAFFGLAKTIPTSKTHHPNSSVSVLSQSTIKLPTSNLNTQHHH